MSENRNRLDEAIVRHAEQAIEPAASERLRETFVQRHGPQLGPLVHELELKKHAELREKVQRLRAALSVARQAMELRRQEGERRLASLHAAMDAQRDLWMAACARYEAVRIANQSALIPLQDRIAAIIGELNAPLPAYSIRQWQRVDGATGSEPGDRTWYPGVDKPFNEP
jgi:hypothetical protein